nr:tRNA (adenosine(37)-N6)-threonylcarbamoyltransferase complex ATPase subunit type 1 TsaE [Acidobacteriota bacterium]
MLKLDVTSQDADGTARVARLISDELRPRDVLLLTGELGAGKTTFTKALCAALGITDVVTSPTFTLVHEYVGGRLSVVHSDLYRLERTGELDDLGLEEARRRGAVLVVEWGDLVPGAFDDALVVTFAHAGGDLRNITLTWRGSGWEARFVRLADRLRAGVGS